MQLDASSSTKDPILHLDCSLEQMTLGSSSQSDIRPEYSHFGLRVSADQLRSVAGTALVPSSSEKTRQQGLGTRSGPWIFYDFRSWDLAIGGS